MGQKVVKGHADGKKHQTVAGKLHLAESITQSIQARSNKKAEKSQTRNLGEPSTSQLHQTAACLDESQPDLTFQKHFSKQN